MAPMLGRPRRATLVAAAALGLASVPALLASRGPRDAPASALRPPAGARPATAPTADSTTRVEMRQVDFYVDPEIVLHIRRLSGTMRSKKGGPVVFDDKGSLVIGLESAEVGLTGEDLSVLLNKYVFGYKGAPLSHLTITTSGNGIVQKGRLHKGVSLPFEIHASLDVAPDGRIRLHPTKTLILGVNGAALLGALNLSLEKLIDLKGARGASVKGNDIFLRPDSILPPPAIEGRVTAVRVEGDQVVQVFGPAPGKAAPAPLAPPDSAAPAYMFFKGGTLRFGKLMMLDAEMQIVDLEGTAPFAFDLDRYMAQLVAGYSRTLPDQGLEVYMRSADSLGHGTPTTARPAVACGEAAGQGGKGARAAGRPVTAPPGTPPAGAAAGASRAARESCRARS